MTRRDDQNLEALRPSDHRQPLRRTGPRPGPDVENPASLESRQRPYAAAPDRIGSDAVDRRIEAGELQRPREPEPSRQWRGDHPRLLQPGRHAEISVRSLEIDVVPLAALERDDDSDVACEPSGPGARREHDDVRPEITVRGLGDDGAVPSPEAHGRAGADVDTQLERRPADGLHEPQRIAMRLVGVVDRAAGPRPEGRLESEGFR